MTYPIRPVSFTRVKFEDNFWSPRIETNRRVTLPYDFKKCEQTGRIANFDKAAGRLSGPHEGRYYNDSDVFKVMEGAAYSLALHPDPELDTYLDGLIDKVAAAQENDGYLYTARTIDPKAVTEEKEGLTRWSNLRKNHELYNVGHLYEAAAAHYQATGKQTLLNVAVKNADLITNVFGLTKQRDIPGHQEIELGLVKLYQATGIIKYLELAKFFLDERGLTNGREVYTDHGLEGYMQDHLPVTEQKEAVGHAVRALYMYAAMADVATLTNDKTYIHALDNLWADVVSSKLYLTGGVGSRHEGEAFGDPFELPNASAYCETCAAIANVFWNHRMFLLHGDAKYIDVLERTLYNSLLAGVSLSGDAFFYPNPLESDGVWDFNLGQAATRSPWFDTSCCPTNMARFLPSLSGYVYAHEGSTLYANLFVGSEAKVGMSVGDVRIHQETAYPFLGEVKFTLQLEQSSKFTLAIRIPGWAQGKPAPSDLYRYEDKQQEPVILEVNGEQVSVELENGFARLHRCWCSDDTVRLYLPMPVRQVLSDKRVSENRDKVAIERGPLVYCAEAVDNHGCALSLALTKDEELTPVWDPDLLNGITILKGLSSTLIPYYAWSHRGVGEMAVWLRMTEPDKAKQT